MDLRKRIIGSEVWAENKGGSEKKEEKFTFSLYERKVPLAFFINVCILLVTMMQRSFDYHETIFENLKLVHCNVIG